MGTICCTTLWLLRNKTSKLPESMKQSLQIFETFGHCSNRTFGFVINVRSSGDLWRAQMDDDATLTIFILSRALFISIPFVTTGHNPVRHRILFDRNLSAMNFIAQWDPFCLRPLALHKVSIYLTGKIEEREITYIHSILKAKTSFW